MREIDRLIDGYSHLKDQPREAEALRTLQKISSLVKPVMRQRGWKVGTLAEFYPTERNLLGVNWNKGQKICLRLRYPSDVQQFLPMEQVVDTMLHELCHIVHDAHDSHFHALWQQLRDEHEQLTRKGYTGEGFLSEGRKLGGRRIPMDEARRRARASAEKRRVLTAGSGQRLGGATVARGTDMRRVIADAVQRRLTVTEGCASGTKASKTLADHATRNGFRTQAEEDDANERAIMQAYIELLQEEEKEKWGLEYQPPSPENPAGMSELARANGTDTTPPSSTVGAKSRSDRPPASMSAQDTATKGTLQPTGSSTPNLSISSTSIKSARIPTMQTDNSPANSPALWTCPTCTLHNPILHLCCSACGIERPPEISESLGSVAVAQSSASARDTSNRRPTFHAQHSSSRARTRPLPQAEVSTDGSNVPGWWECHSCGQNMESMWWTCDRCGVMKTAS